MTYVVTDACIKCKYMDCVEVCPVDCFYEGEVMLVINPNECIDCGVCEPECPAEAILPDTESGLEKWLELNTSFSADWPNITRKKDSPADADEHQGRGGQIRQIFHSRSRHWRLSAAMPLASRNSHANSSRLLICWSTGEYTMMRHVDMLAWPHGLALAGACPDPRRPTRKCPVPPTCAKDTVDASASAAASIPDYEGVRRYRLIPAAAIRGQVSGISFSTRGTYLYVDVIPRGAASSNSMPGRSSASRMNRTSTPQGRHCRPAAAPENGDRGRRVRRRHLPRPDQPL